MDVMSVGETPARRISWPSQASLLLRFFFRDVSLAEATGFLISRDGSHYLVTNRHCVRGRDNNTDAPLSPETGALPDRVRIARNAVGTPGAWVAREEPLYDERGPRWLSHPTLGGRVDVVALPLGNLDSVRVEAYDPWATAPAMSLVPSTTVSIVGFPFGATAGGLFAVWVAGSLASEISVDWEGLPRYLVDARTRTGSSGSPVIAFREVPEIVAGRLEVSLAHRLLGVYSGRVAQESDLGVAWRVETIAEIIEGALREPGIPADPSPAA